MNAYDFDTFLNALSGNTGEARKTADKLSALLRTPEGQQLAQRLMQTGGNALSSALYYAQNGDLDTARQYIQSVLDTPQGAQLAAELARILGR